MTSHEQKTDNTTYFTDSLSSTTNNLAELEECTLWKKQCNELTMQKQAVEIKSDRLLAESRQLIDELKDENIQLKLRIKELEDWNGDFQENPDQSALQSNLDLLTSRNSQLESDLQRLQLQQRNNQLALERLDEYEETISQLQDELDRFRSNKKNPSDELERQLNEEIRSLENTNEQLRQQLQSRDRQIQTTPGSPPSINSSENLSSVYDQFITLLPSEFISSDNTRLALPDRFADLFEQFSAYIGTFTIIQEELDSLKQILHEKQDELEKLRTHLELTTDQLTQLQEEQSFPIKEKSSESDEDDELEGILTFQQRAPSVNSLLSITPGEKQQLIAQNELLSSLLTEKEQELIELQQAEKSRDDLLKSLDHLRASLQQMEVEKEVKQIELNDIRNILDEKLRENSSLKKEKMFFIEKLAQFERERQEQQAIIQIAPKQPTPDREKSPGSFKPSEEYEKLRSDYEQLLELSTRQHEESLSYYNEYTRIFTLYNELTAKFSQLQVDYESVQSLIQQKNEAYLQCQNELNTYQNLLYHQKKKSDDIDLLRSNFNERDRQFQELLEQETRWLTKQSELESNLKLAEETNAKLIVKEKLFEQMQLDFKRITHERDLAIVEKKQCEHRMESNQDKLLQCEERERKLISEIERFSQLGFEDQCARLKEMNLDLNEQIHYFQQERDCRMNEQLIQYQDSLREQIAIVAQLTNENNELRQRFDDEMANKDQFITNLQLEISSKSREIIESNEHFQATNNSRVEKQLVKNILLSYFHTPIDKQQEVVPLIGALVGFTQEEYQKAMNALANNYQNTTGGGSWFTGWLGASSPKPKTQSELPDKSFAELLIQYVDQQSIDGNPQDPMLTLSTDNSSESTSDANPTQSII